MTTVIWLHEALQELAAIWLAAVDRTEITTTVTFIDIALENDPLGAGESREDGRRVLLASPLGVSFRTDPDGRNVWVQAVWAYKKRHRGKS